MLELPSAMTSYYDAVGLLAICDAIESVEGIPLSSLPSRPSDLQKSTLSISSKDTDQIGDPSPNSNSQSPNADPAGSSNDKSMLVPVPYPYPPTPLREKTNYAPSGKSRKLSLPLISYNYGDGSVEHSSERSSPMIYAQSLHHPLQDARLFKGGEKPVESTAPYSYLSAQLSNIPIKQYAVTKTNDSILNKKRDQRSRKLSTSLAELPSMMLDNKMLQMTINGKPASITSPTQTTDHGRAPIMIGGYKVEECHICGRNFKGPKASTHKQQHIRRLHPDDYTPKRGGKKRVVLDPANVPMSQSSPY